MFCQKGSFFSLVAKASTRAQQEDERVSRRILSFLTEFANILLRVEDQECRSVASELFNVLTDTFFLITVFELYIKSLSDYDDTS